MLRSIISVRLCLMLFFFTKEHLIICYNFCRTCKKKIYLVLSLLYVYLADQLLQERHRAGVKEDGQLPLLCVEHDTKVKDTFNV